MSEPDLSFRRFLYECYWRGHAKWVVWSVICFTSAVWLYVNSYQ